MASVLAATTATRKRTVCFVRHGQGEHNVLIDQDRWKDGLKLRDPGLTALGRRQADAVASDVLRTEPDLLVVSPLRRTIQTALEAFGKYLTERRTAGHPVRVELAPDLQEIPVNPCNTGRPASELRSEFVHPCFSFDSLPEHWYLRTGDYADTEDAIAARLRRLTLWIQRQPESTIILVGHQDTFNHMLGAWFSYCELRIYHIDAACEALDSDLSGWELLYPPRPPSRANLICASPGCHLRVHSQADYGGFCCVACGEGGDHGPRCERKVAVRGAKKVDEWGEVIWSKEELEDALQLASQISEITGYWLMD